MRSIASVAVGAQLQAAATASRVWLSAPGIDGLVKHYGDPRRLGQLTHPRQRDAKRIAAVRANSSGTIWRQERERHESGAGPAS